MDMYGMTAASAPSRERKSKGTKSVSSIEIEPSDNGGCSVRVNYQMKGESKYPEFMEPEKLTFESPKAALEAIEKKLGVSSE